MTAFQLPASTPYSLPNQKLRDHQLPRYTLKWKSRQLLVSLKPEPYDPHLHSPENEQWLVECLKRSPARLVRIDPSVGEANLKFWVSAGQKTFKAVYLHLPSASILRRKYCIHWWRLKRLTDWNIAALLLLVLSPVMLGIVCLMSINSPGPIFSRQWCVGERGKLFQRFEFRTTLGSWMRKSSLAQLPQLFNVLRGEMSLVGLHAWSLSNALRLSIEERQQLNALPGIIGPLQSKAKLNLLDLDAINRCNQKYLSNWSLWQDLKILLLAMQMFV